MNEEQQEVSTQTEETKSFGELLENSRSPSESQPDGQAAQTSEAPTVEPVVNESPQAKPEVTEEPKPEVPPEAPKAEEKTVPLQALLSERQKRQQLEQELKQYQVPQEEPQYYQEPVQQQQYAQPDMKHASVMIEIARLKHSDFDEKWNAFVEATQVNPELDKQALLSGNPGEAAYKIGQNYLLEKKYGYGVTQDPVRLADAIRKELEPEITKKVQAEIHAKYTGKAIERAKTPTDISQVRSGNSTPEPFVPKSFGQALASVNRKRGK